MENKDKIILDLCGGTGSWSRPYKEAGLKMNGQKKEKSMKPILFNTEMVKAILDGRKTVTRRLVKLIGNPAWTGYSPDGAVLYGSNNIPAAKAPYRPGDILWVRETWAVWSATNGIAPRIYYKADKDAPVSIRWRPSIHMPREAARLFLMVTGVRVERLQDITPNDCVLEGVEREALTTVGGEFARGIFNDVWDSTIKPADLPRYGWEANPWVWVIEFERVSRSDAAQGGGGDGN